MALSSHFPIVLSGHRSTGWFGRSKNEKVDGSGYDCRAAVVAADDELVGTYKLISSTRKLLDTGEVLDTWGKSPKGFITYGNDGRMLVLIVSDNRSKPESVEKMTDQQRADLFRSMTAYGGTYSSMATRLSI